MILESDEAFVVVATQVVQQAECQRPCLFAELTCLQHLSPTWSPQVILNHVLAVLLMQHCALEYHDRTGVPLASRLSVLRLSRNHVIQRGCLTVAILTHLSVRVVLVVEHLILRSRDVDRLKLTWLALYWNFLCQYENTRVTALRNLVLESEFEILELVSEDQVATTGCLAFASACTVELDVAIFDGPASRNLVLTVTTLAVESLAVEDSDVAVSVNRQLQSLSLSTVRSS